MSDQFSGDLPISITRNGFTNAQSGFFGSNSASFAFVNDTTINATTPPHSAEEVDVTVSTPFDNGTLADGFIYVP